MFFLEMHRETWQYIYLPLSYGRGRESKKKTENVQHGHIMFMFKQGHPSKYTTLLQRWKLLSVPSHFTDAF